MNKLGETKMKDVLVFLGGQSSLNKIDPFEGTLEYPPPSTLPTFKKALELGIDLEIDIRISKDGHVVVFHDDTVDRRTNGTGSVVDKTLKELKELEAGSWFHPQFKGLKIVTFEELLNLFREDKERIIDVHLKETMEGCQEKAVQLVEENEMVDRVQFHSYSNYQGYSNASGLAERVKEINPELKAGLHCCDEEYVHAPLKAIESFPWVDFLWIEETEEPFWINEELISEIHRLGKKAYVLKPKLALRWKQLIGMGIDGLNCYSPLEAKLWLK